MKSQHLALAIIVCLLVAGCQTQQLPRHKALAEPMLAHSVYFTLKDGSDAARQKLTDSCYKYLSNQPGVVFFAAGPLAEEFDRAVNIRNFDVGLHIVFKTRNSHDEYQVSENHLLFIKENKDSLKRVRVYDTFVR